MSTFISAISCLTTSNLPWLLDLTFQIPVQYCSLQHQSLLPSPVTSTTGSCFCFGSTFSFILELFLQWSPVAYQAPTDLGSSSFSVLPFCLFILFMGFSSHGVLMTFSRSHVWMWDLNYKETWVPKNWWQEYWSGLPFPSLVDHILSEISTMTHPSWVALHSMGHSFIELEKSVVHVIRLTIRPLDHSGMT